MQWKHDLLTLCERLRPTDSKVQASKFCHKKTQNFIEVIIVITKTKIERKRPSEYNMLYLYKNISLVVTLSEIKKNCNT